MRAQRGSLVCILLSLIGLGLCLYIGFLHLALLRGELLGGAACGGAGGVFNCHAVTSGHFSSFLHLPLWVWGMMGYFAVLNLASIAYLFPDLRSHSLALLAHVALFSVCVDGVLFVIMVAKVRYLCTFCLLTYAVNILILCAGTWALAKPWPQILGQFKEALRAFIPSTRRPLAGLFFITLLMTSLGSVVLYAATQYVVQGAPGVMRSQVANFVMKEQRVAVDTDGDPIEGAAHARVTLVEFSDFFCPACQKASRFNRILLAGHHDDVQLVFKNYPLDTTCNESIGRMVHPGACTAAAASECAHEQGKFWPLHDLLFARGREYDLSRLPSDVQRLGLNAEAYNTCMSSGRGLEAVRKDVAEGKRLGVGSTPTFIINGLKMPGILSPAVFDMLLEVLSSPGQPSPSSVPK